MERVVAWALCLFLPHAMIMYAMPSAVYASPSVYLHLGKGPASYGAPTEDEVAIEFARCQARAR